MSRARPILSWLNERFRWIALVGTVAGIAFALWSQRGAILDFDWRLAWLPFALAVLLFALAPLVQALSFWLIVRFLGLGSGLADTVVVWTRSFLVRYAPSGALALVLRVRERERLGGTKEQILAATAYEQVAALASGGVVSLVAFAIAPGRVPRPVIVAALATVVAGIAVRPGFLGRPLQALLARRGIELPSLLRGRLLAAAAAVNAAGWVATGVAAWLLVRALAGGEAPSLTWLLGVYAFAWLLGFVVPLLPGGLGVRDGTLVAFLAAPFSAGVATALALALRLANTLGELVAIAGVEVLYRIGGTSGERPRA